MSNILVRTKNELTSPQGKPRVYFSCHPVDFEKYFNTICEDVFKTQDCAIYYEADWQNAAEPERLKSTLSEMQLFIIPVTMRYLVEDNRAKLFEYSFAIEQRIPVLPIAMETGLEDVFENKLNAIEKGYGDVQFLDKTSIDPTQIPYAEKLENKLFSILIGDKLAERVRAAFDAYIFLSYRKKDRALAQELMRLIHRIPFCRDIAIWYDEFLVPGEGWNSAIADAIKKSSLVTLMVTPSLVEPNNFIINHEYPDAVNAGKEVLPAEVIRTDREELYRLFEGIAVPFDGKNETELAERLKSIAIEENDRSPEHNYLVGLAYLGAIDVEKNSNRAVELITSAAEAGLAEAMEKLADMYNSGDGVEREYDTAAEWMDKCCEALERENKETYVFSSKLKKCGKMWSELEQLDKAEKRLKKNLEICITLADETAKSNDYLSSAYYELGDVYIKARKLIDARNCFENMFVITINDETSSCSWSSVSYLKIGEIYELDEKTEEALKLYKLGCEVLSNFTESTECLYLKSLYYVKSAGVYRVTARKDEALKQYKDGIDILNVLVSKTGTVGYRYDLASAYSGLGSLHLANNCLDEAFEGYNKSLEILKNLTNETGTIRCRIELATLYNNFGGVFEAGNKLDDALEQYKKSFEIRKELVETIGTTEAKIKLAASYNHLGRMFEAKGRIDDALEQYEKGFEICKTLEGITETVDVRFNLSNELVNLGNRYYSEDKLDCALGIYEKALEIVRILAEENGSPVFQSILLHSLRNVGIKYEEAGEWDYVMEKYVNAMEIQKNIAEETGTTEAYKALEEDYSSLGRICEIMGRISEAIEYYEKDISILKRLAEKTGNDSYSRRATFETMVNKERIANIK